MSKEMGTHIDDLYTIVSPEMAADMLNKNPLNRDLKPGVAEAYSRDMVAGKWQKNGESIIISADGSILNGQHRLYAIVESGVSVPLLIVRGVANEAIGTIDTGKGRTYADYLKIKGKASGSAATYTHALQAVVRLVHWYDVRWPALPTGGRDKATHSELDLTLHRHPNLPSHIAPVYGSGKAKKLGGVQLGFVYAMAAEKYPNEARAWLEILKTGDADKNNPARVLREMLLVRSLGGRPLDAPTKIVFITKSWNAFARGETVSNFRWLSGEPMPAVFGTPQYTGKRSGHSALFKKEKAATTVAEKSAAAQLGRRKRRPRVGK